MCILTLSRAHAQSPSAPGKERRRLLPRSRLEPIVCRLQTLLWIRCPELRALFFILTEQLPKIRTESSPDFSGILAMVPLLKEPPLLIASQTLAISKSDSALPITISQPASLIANYRLRTAHFRSHVFLILLPVAI